MTKNNFKLGLFIAFVFGISFTSCTTLSTNNGVAVPTGFFDKETRAPIASYKMWLPYAAPGLVDTIGGMKKISINIPDICWFSTGRTEFIEATNGKNVDIEVKNFLFYVEITAFQSN
ncbi:MAG: hypothetical protein LBC27_03660 [Spirochaetaceae bacterium]|jgi:hypothetical protein|nr:hypothetical protein [Spirochaetaceae bacterium]